MLFPTAIGLVMGAISAYMAKSRGKNPYLWFFLGSLFGIFGLMLLVFSSKPAPKAAQKGEVGSSPTIDITPAIDPEHQNKLWHYLEPDNTQHGPMSFDALSRALMEGKISKNTLVWSENLEGWKPLGEILVK